VDAFPEHSLQFKFFPAQEAVGANLQRRKVLTGLAAGAALVPLVRSTPGSWRSGMCDCCVLRERSMKSSSCRAALPEMAIIQGGDPKQLARAGGGRIGRDAALHLGWRHRPGKTEYWLGPHDPEVVAEIVRQCLNAGAKRVIVTDVSCNDARRCFQRSGIAEAAKLAGADVNLPEPSRFKEVDLQGEVLHAWPVLDTFLNVDNVINIPIAKHHGLTGTTLGMKNWFGMLGGQRNELHQKIHEGLVDLADFVVRP
jgi:hypothetical protein